MRKAIKHNKEDELYLLKFVLGQGCSTEYGKYFKLSTDIRITESLPLERRGCRPDILLELGIFQLRLQLKYKAYQECLSSHPPLSFSIYDDIFTKREKNRAWLGTLVLGSMTQTEENRRLDYIGEKRK